MDDDRLDDRILAAVRARWRKVAMVIALSTDDRSPTLEDDCDRVAARIVAMVAEGRLIARGDISRWRRSEVRLP